MTDGCRNKAGSEDSFQEPWEWSKGRHQQPEGGVGQREFIFVLFIRWND